MVDFSNYVSQFRRPQSYSLGPALRQLRQQDQAQQGIDNQASQYASTRSDTQSTNAANYARDTATAANSKEKLRYDRQMAAIEEARRAGQSGRGGVARALIPQIRELGGQAVENPDGTFFFKEGAAPSLAAPDVAGARQQIYGGAPGPQRNPMDPPALPGASAAALPPKPAQSPAIGAPPAPPAGAPPDPGPPPGAAVDAPPGPARSVPPEGAVWLPPGVDPGPQPQASAPAAPTSAEADLAALNAAGGEPDLESAPAPQAPQPTGPNPFQPPGLDDAYVIDPRRVREQNALRLDPLLRGIEGATPERFREQVKQYTAGLGSLGYSPEETLKLTHPYFSDLMGAYRGEVAAEGQAGRLALSQRHQESVQADKYRAMGLRRAEKLINLDGLKKSKERMESTRDVESLLDSAHRNSNTADSLIRKVYEMQASGVMTDNDYKQTKGEDLKTVWQYIKDKTIEKFLNPDGGGLPPDVVKNIRELVEISLNNRRREFGSARDSLFRAWKTTNNEYEREGIADTLTAALPEEYWPQELSGGQSGEVPTYDPEETGQFDAPEGEEPEVHLDSDPTSGPPPLGDNLGVVPLPKEPNRTGAQRGSKVPPKPPRRPPPPPKQKAVKDMTPEELRKAGEEFQ